MIESIKGQLKSQIGRFRLLAHAEGISFLLILFITMPLKYQMDMPGPNKFIGMLHGILFIVYIVATIQMKWQHKWSYFKTFLSLTASILPFGTFIFIKKYYPHAQ